MPKAENIKGLWCWSKDRWFFKYSAIVIAGEITPYIRVQKLNQMDQRYRIYENVNQAGRDAVKVCRGEMSFEVFRAQYNLVPMEPYQHLKE